MANFIFLVYFVILDCRVKFKVPIILGTPFFATERVLVDMKRNELKFILNDKDVKFNAFQSMKKLRDRCVVSVIDTIEESKIEVPIEERFVVENLATLLMNFYGDGIKEYDETIFSLTGISLYLYSLKKLNIDLKNSLNLPAKSSIEELSVLELQN